MLTTLDSSLLVRMRALWSELNEYELLEPVLLIERYQEDSIFIHEQPCEGTPGADKHAAQKR